MPAIKPRTFGWPMEKRARKREQYVTITCTTNKATIHIVNMDSNPANTYLVTPNVPTRVLLKERNIDNLWQFLYKQTNVTAIDLSEMNLRKCYSFAELFSGATNLTKIIFPKYRINQTSWRSAFDGLSNLETLDLSMFDFGMYKNTPSSMIKFDRTWAGCRKLKSIKFGYNAMANIDFSDSPLDEESVLSVINGLAKVTSQTVKFKKESYNTLTIEEIAMATSKGWTIASV